MTSEAASSPAPDTVAVAVVNWNSGALLGRCLDALRAQTRPALRVIVVDNGSTDGSAEAARNRSGVELMSLGGNLGFAAANNRAIERAEDCAWIALLNPDAFPEPGWLDALVRAARDPRYTLFASRQLQADDPTRLDGAGDVYAVSGLAWRRHYDLPAAGHALVPQEVFSPCAAAALYSRAAVEEVGGFDESFFCYFEDVDLAFRLRLRGHRCLYVPDAVVHHVGSAMAGRRSAFSLYHGHRNLVWTWWKNMPALLLALYGPLHLLLNLVSLAWFTWRGEGGPVFRAKRDALLGLPRVLRDRRRVQATRSAGAWDLRGAMVGGRQALGLGRGLG